MIDLTPLDVRKKRGDFAKGVRGYSVPEVDSFLELVAERLEELVKENLTLRERADRLAEQVTAQTGRERAVHEAAQLGLEPSGLLGSAYIVPFMFIYEPALLLIGDWQTVALAVGTALIGVMCLASGLHR